MRKLTLASTAAFEAMRSFKQSNTEVVLDNGEASLILFGNEIAHKSSDGEITITNAGYPSNTTKERLNGITGVSINQSKGVWFLNGERWDGSWTKVGVPQ